MLDETSGRYIAKGKIIQLSRRETRMLYYLIKNKHRIVTYEELSRFVYCNYRYDKYVRDSLLVLVHKLRAKIKGVLEITNKTQLGYGIKYIKES